MNDLERRLRAALSAATEQAPPGLTDAIARRHRRHQFRVGASLLAAIAAVALAVPAVTSALRGGSDGGTVATPGSISSPGRSAAPRTHGGLHAAVGTVLSGCGAEASQGGLGRDWQASPATHAGPLWFFDGGHSAAPLRLYVAVVVLSKLQPGSAVVVRVAPAGRPYLRFLYGPADSLNPGTRHTMRSGESGVTFVACQPGRGSARSPGITDYYGGFLVMGARCVPVRAWIPGRARPLLIRLGACPAR